MDDNLIYEPVSYYHRIARLSSILTKNGILNSSYGIWESASPALSIKIGTVFEPISSLRIKRRYYIGLKEALSTTLLKKLK